MGGDLAGLSHGGWLLTAQQPQGHHAGHSAACHESIQAGSAPARAPRTAVALFTKWRKTPASSERVRRTYSVPCGTQRLALLRNCSS